MLLENNNLITDCNLGIDYARMAVEAQAIDPDMQAFRTAVTRLRLEDVAFDGANITLLCNVSKGHPHPVVPAGWKRQLYKGCTWPLSPRQETFSKTGGSLVRLARSQEGHQGLDCVDCQHATVHRHTRASVAQSFHVVILFLL